MNAKINFKCLSLEAEITSNSLQLSSRAFHRNESTKEGSCVLFRSHFFTSWIQTFFPNYFLNSYICKQKTTTTTISLFIFQTEMRHGVESSSRDFTSTTTTFKYLISMKILYVYNLTLSCKSWKSVREWRGCYEELTTLFLYSSLKVLYLPESGRGKIAQ